MKALIDGARKTLRIKMFEFDSEVLIQAVLDAQRRFVDVAVLLNPVRSSGARPNDETLARFREAGIRVDWTSKLFKISHEKSMIIDGERLLISTFNYCDKYLTKTRDYGVLIEDRVIIEEVAACYEADAAGRPFGLHADSPLAWGNQSARCVVADFIDATEKELCIHHPKFHDVAILDRELGIVADDKSLVKALTKTFEDDWHEARKWEPPNPLECDMVAHAEAESEPDGIDHE